MSTFKIYGKEKVKKNVVIYSKKKQDLERYISFEKCNFKQNLQF